MFIFWMMLGATVGFVLCAMLTAGKLDDYASDAACWRELAIEANQQLAATKEESQ